jgi:hypothetical protein
MKYGRGEPEEDDWDACTCRTPTVNSTSIDPPEPKSIWNEWCPVHGKDPDEAYEQARDDAWQFPNSERWDDYE